MKNLSKSKRILSLGILLSISATALTACSHDDNKSNYDPNYGHSVEATTKAPAPATATTKPTAKPAPSATAKADPKDKGTVGHSTYTMDELNKMTIKERDDALNAEMNAKYARAVDVIDIDEALAKADPSLNKTFPATNFDHKAAVEFGLNFLDDLSSQANFYDSDTTNDEAVFSDPSISDRMDASLLTFVKNNFKKNGAQGLILAANGQGMMGQTQDMKGKTVDVLFDGVPLSDYHNNIPDILAENLSSTGKKADAQDVITISGTKKMTFTFKNGLSASDVPVIYWVSVVPSGDSFLVSNLTYKYDTFEVKGIK